MDVQHKVSFESIWDGYFAYLSRVRQETPDIETLRDKDRHLWGKSFADQLTADIASRFAKVTAADV